MSLIGQEQTILLSLVVLSLVIFGWWSEKTKIGSLLSGTIVVMVLGLIASNLNIVPHSSDVYDIIATYSVPLAIPLLLLNTDFRRIFKETGITLIAFIFACLGTILGAVIGFAMVNMGDSGHAWAGVYAASYIGGTLNFVSVSSVLEVPRTEATAALAADTLMGMGFLFLLIIVSCSKWLESTFRASKNELKQEASDNLVDLSTKAVNVTHLITVFSLSVAIFWISQEITIWLNLEKYTLLVVTILSLSAAFFVPRKISNSEGVFQSGILAMYGFFVVISLGTDFSQLMIHAIPFLLFLSCLLLTHIVVVGLLCKIMKIGLPEMVTASCACVLGTSVAAAMAANKGWAQLATPGILCGTLGYAIGNFIGIFLSNILATS